VTITTTNVINQDFGFFALMDFGDLPSSYNATLIADGGAYHLTPTLLLGSSVDLEGDGTENALANGDGADDGVFRDMTDFWIPGATVNLTVTVSGAGPVAGWFDFNGDGDFNDPGEFQDFGTIAGTTSVNLTLPSAYITGTTVNTRFRVFDPLNLPGGSLDAGDVVGSAVDGEVEDYQWNFGPTAVRLLGVASRERQVEPGFLLLLLLATVLGITTLVMFRHKRKTDRQYT
jgi:hypothetical protein